MKTILFQGDSVTDCYRREEATLGYGHGYAAMVAAELGTRAPGSYTFYNRGIGGDRITNIYARIKTDVLNLKPDVMSLMVGINDVWHNSPVRNGTDTPKFRMIYDLVMTEVKETLPDCKLILMTPYFTETFASWVPEFRTQVIEKQEVVREMAKKYGAALYDTQAVIDEAVKHAPIEYWTMDGVHPTLFGHRLLADGWIKVFDTL